MKPHSVYLTFLIIHLSAFALFTGTLIANIVNSNQLWQYSDKDAAITRALFNTTGKYNRIMGICLGVAVLMGIGMMIQMHQVYGPQLWFRIKIGLLIVLMVVRIFYSRNLGQLKKGINNEIKVSFADLRKKISLFQLLSVLIIGCIIILSVARFN
ncbi:hypothetical protein A4H97_11910 [Niastella yeongjuensis]|uniref:Copper resistance protein D domain-containing protein n=1 Tax=Niastella yeongjuensis TaxID=354355 RepID=A0A1V9EA43_9BACT|nr:hypothetical protein [Niastella yeongjuensis]OQP42854.1 hypothetical protein A4H97_11910 [Niastella yeongjuensis]SEO56896.1 hypothetical protein SAMN05660816_03048 [Niastella yeongjuensis]